MRRNDLTIIIKTFLRPNALSMLLNSIWKMYPDVRIYVADDSGKDSVRGDVEKYILLPFDSGLSAGRNILLDKVKTKYFMLLDDDTIFTKHTKLEWPLRILDEYRNIDLVSGKYLPAKFFGKQVIEDGVFIRDMEKSNGVVDGFPVYDFTANFFVARTEKVLKVGWDEDLKIQEHMDFFWRARGVLNCTHLPYFSSENSHVTNKEYAKFRGRSKQFQKLQCKKLGVKRIKSRFGQANIDHLKLNKLAISP